jgi:hypothetical protein
MNSGMDRTMDASAKICDGTSKIARRFENAMHNNFKMALVRRGPKLQLVERRLCQIKHL